jgi:predicted amidohydrolase YtcJ
VIVHVLSRHALDTLLDGIEALARSQGKPDATRLFRVEHADEVTPEQAQRLARLGVGVCSNPSMIPEWRHEHAFPLRTLLDAGVELAFGSDWVGRHVPERPLEPLEAVKLAVTHGGLGCAECITAAEALRAFTAGSARAEAMSTVKGTLEVGRFADLIVLSRDPLKTPPEAIGSIEVLLTMVGGRVVHRAGAFSASRGVPGPRPSR